jgi:DedD protein
MSDKEADSTRFNPRHRILGAIILVSLAVIFIPLILHEDDAPPDLKLVSEIPPRTAAPAAGETRVVVTPLAQLGEEKVETPITAEPAKPAAPAAEPKKAAPAELAAVAEPAEPASQPIAEAPAQKEAVTEPDKPAKIGRRYIVQVGVYSHADNAQRIEQKLKRAGHAVLSDTIKIDGGKAQRIRVGPFKDRVAADKAVAQIQKDAGIQGIVRAYP